MKHMVRRIICLVTVERIVFTRGVHMGLWKTGAGDITVRDCRFHNNKRTAPVSNVYHCGRGVGADLEGTSGTTLAVVSNCVFEGNVFGTGGCDHGGGLYLTGLREADLSDCLFLTNGIPFGATVYPVYTGYSGGLRGAAVHASGAPVVAVNCSFVGNRSNAKRSEPESGQSKNGEAADRVLKRKGFRFSARWVLGGRWRRERPCGIISTSKDTREP